MKILTRLFLPAVLLLAGILTLGAQTTPATPAPKTVLVLSAFQLDLSTNLIAAQAMREEFDKAADLRLDVYYEYLDLNRFPEPAVQQNFFDLLTARYKNKQIDLVVVSSEAMLRLWLAQRAEILPETPVVFFDIATGHIDALDLPANVTGVSGEEECEKTVRWVLDTMPDVNEIVLVGGVGKIEQAFFNDLQKMQEDLEGQVNFTNLAGLPLAEINQRAAKLPDTSIVLYHPMFEDADGNKYRPLDVLRELTANSPVPVIGSFDNFMGAGIIGGYMYSIDQQARDAAKISLRVLHGEPISSIPIAKNESNRFIFDHLVLQRFGIPLSALPPESIIKNRQDSMWEQHQGQIIAAALVMTVLLILIVVLISVTRRLKTTSLALSHLNVNLETQVQERTAALSQANQTLQLEITERTRIEAALRESEARFRSYFELPLTGRAITSPDQLWLDVNSALCEMLSYTKEELMQMTWGELTYPVDIEADLVQFNRVMAGEIDGYTLEKRFLRKDGGIVHTQLVVQCLRRPDRSIEYFVALIQDINESKRVEEQLRETHDALQTIIYSSPLAILTMDADDRVTMWNPAAEAMFGWSDKQVVGQTDPTVPESKAREYEALRNATLVGMAFSNMDTLRMKKDGTEFPVSLSVAPLRGQQSQVIGRLHVIADITERKKYQEELRQQATTDELTRVSNRRHFIELATNEIKRAVRLKRPPAIALIDIDHFKQINDTYGHAAGDQALVGFTQICQRQIRQIDVFARFGGDEFVVLLPETNQEQAYEVIERIRSTLMAQPLELDGKPVPITISSGIASLSSDQESFEMLLNQADQALYHAKELGRNKVVRSDRL